MEVPPPPFLVSRRYTSTASCHHLSSRKGEEGETGEKDRVGPGFSFLSRVVSEQNGGRELFTVKLAPRRNHRM
jgi:hypothetical protein